MKQVLTGVLVVPDSAPVCRMLGAREDFNDSLIMYAIAPNMVGVIGSAVAAGILPATSDKQKTGKNVKMLLITT